MTLGRYGQPVGDPPGSRRRPVDEPTLRDAYRNTTGSDLRPRRTVEPCACGVDIVSISDRDDDIALAVRAHNNTPTHLAWSAALPLDSTVGVSGPVDLSGTGPDASSPAGEAA